MTPCPFCESQLPDGAAASGNNGLGICVACFNPLLLQWENGNVSARALPGAHDVRQLAPPGSIGASLLEQVSSGIDDLPVLPEVSQRILALLKNTDFGMPELSALIKKDPVVAVAIMKQANSAAFGGLNEIKDLNGACARLGMRAIANTVQLVANRSLFITGNAGLKTSMEGLWRHSVATAHCANEIARLTLAPDRESIFLAGLIHDIGKVIMLEMIASPRSKVLADLQGNPELLREVMDSLHGLLGLLICQAWKLPPLFRASVYFHHKPDQCPIKDWLAATHMIALANTIAQVEGYGMYNEKIDVFLASDSSTMHLGLTDVKLASLRVDLSDTLEALFEATG